jgi:hypothetical protein
VLFVLQQMDKASIIGDTITYLKELKLEIEELERLEVACEIKAAGESQPLDSSEQADKVCRPSISQKSDEQECSQPHEIPTLSSDPNRVEEDQESTNSVTPLPSIVNLDIATI